ncbi:MAG: hydantoinase [Spirochaetes bacterium RBG_16_49_21]|nr:MAG: hydantoinase [Spirochaetes bacterium RBG_16_49_21]
MYLGLDVGGTHTDAVLIGEEGIVSHYKAVTDHDNLLLSVRKAIEGIAGGADRKKIQRINLSTTLSTNAIVENRLEDVCVIISAGPGIDPDNFKIGTYYYVIDGSIDHRGTEVRSLDAKLVSRIAGEVSGKGVKAFAAVTKFSTRNPEHENLIAREIGSAADFVTLGHKLSGRLSFPRRIVTAYFNSAVRRIFENFSDSIEECLCDLGIEAEVNVLKADGGTMPFSFSRGIPVESILSGPAASVMGIAALCDITRDSIMLDIGGTTTDIAIFAAGAPLIEKEGISLQGFPTLVRSLMTRSIGVGGDSAIHVNGGSVSVGPDRGGPAMAAGGTVPTLVDAFNAIRIVRFMDAEASAQGIADLAKKNGTSPDKLADAAIEYAVARIKDEVNAMLGEIRDRPVYTIHEMLEGKKIQPALVYIMGGPAEAFRDKFAGWLGAEVVVPPNYDVANAVGAALAKTTIDIELFADTCRRTMIIPNIDVRRTIPSGYTLRDAERDARNSLAEHRGSLSAPAGGSDMEIIESSSFNIVEGFYTVGRDIRVKCQIKPGVIKRLT